MRWDPCVTHRGEEVSEFVSRVFDRDRRVLLICGAGFDPRATEVARILTRYSRAVTAALIVDEIRLPANPNLVELAKSNRDRLIASVASSEIIAIEIFANDLAPIGGQKLVERLRDVDLTRY